MRTYGSRLLCSLAAASAAFVAAETARAQDPSTLAQQRFLRGLAQFDRRQFAAALEEFRGSYQLRSSPNSRLYIARSLVQLQRVPEAVSEYETCIQEAHEHANTDPRYSETERAATSELRAIEPQVGRVRITLVNAPRQVGVRIGAAVIPAAGLALAIPAQPGSLTIVAEAVGSPPITQTVQLRAGATESVSLTFAVDAQRQQEAALAAGITTPGAAPRPSYDLGQWLTRSRHPLRWVMFGAWGVGAAGVITFGAAGAATSSTFAGLQLRCGSARCPSSEQAAVDAGRTTQTIANVGLGVGVVGLVAGTALLFVGPVIDRSPGAAPRPVVMFDGRGLSVTGAF